MKGLLVALLLSATGQRAGVPVEFDVSARKVTATGSTTARALRDRFSDVVNVKDYGAVGNGVADDTAAIQAAISFAKNNRAAVFLPPGRYRTTATLNITGSVVMYGRSRIGMGSAQILYDGTGDAIHIYDVVQQGGFVYAVVLRDLAIIGQQAGGVGIRASNASECLLDHVGVQGKDSATKLATAIRLDAGICQIDSPYVAYSTIGVDGTQGNPADRYSVNAAISISDGDFWWNDTALKLNGAVGWDIRGTWFEKNDYVMRFDDSATDDAVEAANVFFHHNSAVFNGGTDYTNQVLALVKNTGSKLLNLDNLRIESNRVFFSSGQSSTVNPIVVDLSATTHADTALHVAVSGNRFEGHSGAIVSANSTRAEFDFTHNRTKTSGGGSYQGEATGQYRATAAKRVRDTFVIGTNENPTSQIYYAKAYVPSLAHGFLSLSVQGGGTAVIDASLADSFEVVPVSSGAAYTINSPGFASKGQHLTVTLKNATSGALGAITWGATYKMAAWTSPTNGFSRSITFRYDGTNWIEVSRTPADVPN